MKTTIGIDPGKNGAIAILNDGVLEAVHGMPQTVADLTDLVRSIVAARPAGAQITAYVEQVHSSPQMGVVSAFTFGRGLGNLEAALAAFGVRLVWVRPQVWQKALGCLTGGDKNVSKRRAQELFPGLKITHGNADALLIARYGEVQP